MQGIIIPILERRKTKALIVDVTFQGHQNHDKTRIHTQLCLTLGLILYTHPLIYYSSFVSSFILS